MKLKDVLAKYDAAVDFYLRECEVNGSAKATVRNYADRLKGFREFFVRLHEWDDEVRDPWYPDFQEWRDYLLETNKTTTVERKMSDVSIFFDYVSDPELGDMRFYEKNPIPNRLIPNVKKENERPYNEILANEDVMKLWDSRVPELKRGQNRCNWDRNYAIVILLLTSEIRNKELLDLTLSDVDFEYNEIQIRHGKGDKYRCVDVPDIAISAIKRYLDSGARPDWVRDDEPLFGTQRAKVRAAPANDKSIWHRGHRNWLSELVGRHVRMVTGVEGVTSHDLRHVGAKLDLNSGMDVWELQAKLGHSSTSMTQRYAGKLQPKRRRDSVSHVMKARDDAARRIV